VNDPEIQELIDQYNVFDIFEPTSNDEINEACLKYPDLSWTRLIKPRINGEDNPLWFNVTWFDGDGEERSIWEYHDGDDARFIRFNNHKLSKIDTSTNTDNSIIISKDWYSLVRTLKWQVEHETVDLCHTTKQDAENDIRGFYNS